MKCQHCKLPADFYCECLTKFCKDHLATHCESCLISKVNPIKNYKTIENLSKELSQRISKINKKTREVVLKTHELISKITNLCNANVAKLKKLSDKYQHILEKQIIIELEKTLKSKIIENEVTTPDSKVIETYYSQNLYSEKLLKNIDFRDAIHAKTLIEKKYDLRLEGHKDPIKFIAISKDNKYVVSGGGNLNNGELKLWSIEEKSQIGQLTGHTDMIWSIAITNDNKYVVSGSIDRTIRIWDLKDIKEKAVLNGHTKSVTVVTVTHDNKYIVSGSWDNTIRLWDIVEKQQISVFEGHTNMITTIAITYNNKYAVTGSRDSTIRVWNLEEKCHEMMFIGHTSIVNVIRITNDDKYIVSEAGYYKSGELIVWNLKTKNQETFIKEIKDDNMWVKEYSEIKSMLKKFISRGPEPSSIGNFFESIFDIFRGQVYSLA